MAFIKWIFRLSLPEKGCEDVSYITMILGLSNPKISLREDFFQCILLERCSKLAPRGRGSCIQALEELVLASSIELPWICTIHMIC